MDALAHSLKDIVTDFLLFADTRCYYHPIRYEIGVRTWRDSPTHRPHNDPKSHHG